MSTKATVVEKGIVGESEGGIRDQRNHVGDSRTSIPGEVLGNTYEREVMILAKEAYVTWHGSCRVVEETGEKKVTERASALEVDRLADGLRETYGRFGWGRIEVSNLDINENELRIIMRESPMVGGGSDKGPVCWHVRASIEVIVSAILAVEATAFEVACEAVNRDHCEFRVSWEVPPASRGRLKDGVPLRGLFTTANMLIR